jgi:hypothetical protein
LKVRIDNPTPGGARFTSLAKARFYEAQGCARVSADGKRLRFIEDHHRKKSAELSTQQALDEEYRLTQCGYDRRQDVLTLNEIANIPVLRPVVLATIPKKMRSYSSRRSGKVKILVQNGVPIHRAPVVSIEAGRKLSKIQKKVEVPKAA